MVKLGYVVIFRGNDCHHALKLVIIIIIWFMNTFSLARHPRNLVQFRLCNGLFYKHMIKADVVLSGTSRGDRLAMFVVGACKERASTRDPARTVPLYRCM